MANPQQQWVVSTIPQGFKSQCPGDIDDYYYLWNVLFLINTAPNLTYISMYEETTYQQILGYYGEDDIPFGTPTIEERVWGVVEKIVQDATILYPHIKPLIAPLTQKYPEGFDLYVDTLQPELSTVFLHVEEI